MKATKVRETIGVIFALTVLILFMSIGAHFAGWDIPGLSHIASMIGLGAPGN